MARDEESTGWVGSFAHLPGYDPCQLSRQAGSKINLGGSCPEGGVLPGSPALPDRGREPRRRKIVDFPTRQLLGAWLYLVHPERRDAVVQGSSERFAGGAR